MTLGLITGIAVDTVTEKLYFVTAPVLDPTKSPTKEPAASTNTTSAKEHEHLYSAVVEQSSGDALS